MRESRFSSIAYYGCNPTSQNHFPMLDGAAPPRASFLDRLDGKSTQNKTNSLRNMRNFVAKTIETQFRRARPATGKGLCYVGHDPPGQGQLEQHDCSILQYGQAIGFDARMELAPVPCPLRRSQLSHDRWAALELHGH